MPMPEHFDAAYAEDPAGLYAPQALLSLLALDVIVEDLEIEAQDADRGRRRRRSPGSAMTLPSAAGSPALHADAALYR